MEETTIQSLLDLLALHGGEIVSTASLSPESINQSRAAGRLYVDSSGLGFSWEPRLDKFPTTKEEVELFEKWFPLDVEMPEEMKDPEWLWKRKRNQSGLFPLSSLTHQRTKEVVVPDVHQCYAYCREKAGLVEGEEEDKYDAVRFSIFEDGMKWAISEIHRLNPPCDKKEESKDNWISVDENEPRDNQKIMMYCIGEEAEFIATGHYEEGDYENYIGDHFEGNKIPIITHWQPLPSPPIVSHSPATNK